MKKKHYILIAVIVIVLVLIYVYRSQISTILGIGSSTRQYHGGGRMGGGGHGRHGHGGHFRSGWGWGYWYPYYTTSACPTGKCDASDGTIGTWITNVDGTCTCRSDKK